MSIEIASLTALELLPLHNPQFEAVKKLEKEKKASEDDSRMSQKHIQKITDDHTKKVDDLLKVKESELQTV